MAAKAVYASCVLAIYVTRDEMARLLARETVVAPLVAANGVLVDRGAIVSLTDEVIDVLKPIYATDLAIYNSVPRKPSGVPKNSLYPKKGRV